MSSDWVVGHPSDNKAFVATIVIASLLVASFFVGTGFMLYYWIKSWRGDDVFGKHISEGGDEKANIDLEAGRVMPSTFPDENDESPIVDASKWRQETITVDTSPSGSESELSSARSSSEISSNDEYSPTRPISRDFHELYPAPR